MALRDRELHTRNDDDCHLQINWFLGQEMIKFGGSQGQKSRSQEAEICQTCEGDILNTYEQILLQAWRWWPTWQGHEAINFQGPEVKVQGHRRL